MWPYPPNWSGTTLPGNDDTVVFADGAARYSINMAGISVNFDALRFDSATAYTIDSGHLYFGNLATIAAGGLVTHEIKANVDLHPGSTWWINEIAGVEVSGAFDTGSGLTKAGNGTLTISGANNNSAGNVTIDAGSVVLAGGSAYSDSASIDVGSNGTLHINATETIGGLAGSGAVTLGSNELKFTGNAGSSFSGAISGDESSTLTMSGPGTQTITGDVDAGAFYGSGGTLEFDGGSFTMPDLATTDFDVAGADVNVRNGAVVQTPSTGSGASPSGLAMIRNGSRMLVTGATSQLIVGRVDVGLQSTGTLDVENGGQVDISLGVAPVLVVASGPSGTANGTVSIKSGASLAVGGAIVGLFTDNTGSLTVDGQGSTLDATNLSLGGVGPTQAGGVGNVDVTNGGSVNVANDVSIYTSNSQLSIDGGDLTAKKVTLFNGATPVVQISDPASGSALVLGASDSDATINFGVTDATGGPGSIEKIGSGLLTISHETSHTGGLRVSEGGLRLEDAARQFTSLTGSGDVILDNGSHLDGTGVIGGHLYAGSAATIEPSNENGGSIGAIDCGALDILTGATLDIQLGGANNYDQINVSGQAALGGTLQLSYANGFTASDGDWFRVVSAGSLTGDIESIVPPDAQNWVSYQADGALFVGVCSDPSSCLALCAEELAAYAPGADVQSSVSDGNIVVVNRGADGFEILAAPNPTFGPPLATVSGAIYTMVGCKALALDNDLLFVAGGTPRIYDVSDPMNPTLLSTINGYFAWNMAAQGNLLAVALEDGLALFDITDPANPILRSNTPADSYDAGNVKFHNGLLYWNAENGDNYQGVLAIIDVTDPAAPVQLGSISSSFFPSEPQFRGDVAITANALGVRTIDISDPANPTEIAFLPDNSAFTGDAALEGALLYRADTQRGVLVYDVRDANAPAEVGELPAYTGAFGLTNVGGLLYVSRYDGGLAVINVDDSDSDGVVAGCDVCNGDDASGDSDGDGICDNLDICPGSDDNIDTDGDGVPDGCDVCPGSDDNVDNDGDGVPDGCDVCPGSDDHIDTDGDGVPDGCDVCSGFDDNVDSDGDGVPDGCDICPGSDDNVDSDGDGVPDGCDVCPGFDDNIDTNGNGIPDGCEPACPGDANGDLHVDITDLGLLLSQFGMSGANLEGDVDHDGDVDISDLGLVLSGFGTTCS